ncbi:hypothetical protein MGG_16899 [Pyricularia oryzae 70-15]|uniref:Uncharacterized protein n=1 Tax=Pyricularia oryzae (strain 70-15 / ATCC MYA-4617 / FGSC 8958) TaxID=242507 RepID=G4N5N1_PYRO7|nr:uncharacterized protein MGG_16899 [Pyricularia oryzae 70-15]EHA53021.1 hypothetical protein MGG_16899 [Pyricularia oryzae 70-15]
MPDGLANWVPGLMRLIFGPRNVTITVVLKAFDFAFPRGIRFGYALLHFFPNDGCGGGCSWPVVWTTVVPLHQPHVTKSEVQANPVERIVNAEPWPFGCLYSSAAAELFALNLGR